MEAKYLLHCFEKDAGSQAVLHLAEYLSSPLETRLLKPNNVNEGIYKKSLTKTFPMLAIGEESFIERTPAILRFIDRSKGASLSSGLGDKAPLADSLLDSIYFEFGQSFFALSAESKKLIQLEQPEIDLLTEKAIEGLKHFDQFFGKELELGINLADFLIVEVLSAIAEVEGLKKTFGEMKNLKKRLEKLKADDKFAKGSEEQLKVLLAF